MKKVVKIGMILLLFVVLGLGINYVFYEPTVMNAFVASKIYKEPANSYFKDDNFYKCVVDAYNSENNTSVPYTYNLSDEELQTITFLSCNGYSKDDSEKISSTIGLDKLTSLTHLDIAYNKVVNLNLNKNTLLETLFVSNNNLVSLDLSNNPLLVSLGAGYNKITTLDVSSNTELNYLHVDYNRLLYLDVSNNTLLTDLDVSSNSLVSLDVNNNTALKYLDAEANDLINLDVSNNPLLINLDICNNELVSLNTIGAFSLKKLLANINDLTDLDVSQNKSLIKLDVTSNDLVNLNVDGLTLLESLLTGSNKLTDLDVSSNISLKTLNVGYNNLTSLDVTNLTLLESFSAQSNNLKSMDLSKNTSLTNLSLSNNFIEAFVAYDEFDISNLSSIISDAQKITYINLGGNVIIKPSEEYVYYYNDRLSIKKAEILSEFINNLGLVNLDAKVYNGSEEVSDGYVSHGNILKIIDEDSNIIDEVSIEVFDGLSGFDDSNFYKCVVDTYNSENNTDIDYTKILSDEQLSSITELICYGYKKDNSEKITSTNGVEKLVNLSTLSLTDNLIESINLSKNTKLLELYLGGNRLNSLDVSQNDKLEVLDIGFWSYLSTSSKSGKSEGNDITQLDLSNNLLLKKLYVTKNQLTNLDISKNTLLIELYANFNQLTLLNTDNNVNLKYLNIASNKITSVNLENNIELVELRIGDNFDGNQVTNLDVSHNLLLKKLYISRNKLTTLDVSENTLLTDLLVSNNRLTELDVSNNVALQYLDVYGNKLKELDVSNNKLLFDLDVSYNQLIHLDISSNDALKYLSIYGNPYGNEYYVYKGEIIVLEENVKLPDCLNWSDPIWTSSNVDVVSVDENGVVNALNIGSVDVLRTVEYRYLITDKVNVFEITSDKYVIDEENNVIYLGIDNSVDVIKSNIYKSHEDIEIEVDLENDKLIVKYNNQALKEFSLVRVSSEEYDLTKDYIYIGTSAIDDSEIDVINGTKFVEDNRLLIKYGDVVLQEYDLVSISSEEYDLTKDYIYIGTGKVDTNKISVINAAVAVNEDKVEIVSDSNIFESFSILSIDFGNLNEFHNLVVLSDTITYDDFIGNIAVGDNITYKIFKDDTEVTSGNVEIGMVLKVYYNDEEIDSFEITDEYLNFDESLRIDEENKYLSSINLGTKVSDILDKISTSGEVSFINKDTDILTENDLVGTGGKVIVKLSVSTYEYSLVVSGDVDGDGKLALSDIMKTANYVYKNKESLSDEYLRAADYDGNGLYNLQDIMKLANKLYKGGN